MSDIFLHNGFGGNPVYDAECVIVIAPPDNNLVIDFSEIESDGVNIVAECCDAVFTPDVFMVYIKDAAAITLVLEKLLNLVIKADKAYAKRYKAQRAKNNKTKTQIHTRKSNTEIREIMARHPEAETEACTADNGGKP